jgi:acyl carrier protein
MPVCLDFTCVTEHLAQTFEKVRTIVADDLGIEDPDTITMESAFIDDLHADSLDVVEFIMQLEEDFGLTISDEDAEKIRTIGDAVQYIVAHGG